ncbi:MAG TPA: glycosyl hydrolase family 28 protein [Tepidisphaeraceae bacterium]|jgi:hypothetical protein
MTKNKLWISILCVFWALTPAFGVDDKNLQVRRAPTGEPLSAQFKVSVDGKSVPVYLARVVALSAERRGPVHAWDLKDTTEVGFASIDIAAKVEVAIDCPDEVKSAKVLPSVRGIVPAISGKRITFAVSQPGELVVDVNGDWLHSLHLFVNPIEKDVPKQGDPNVIYFGPGVHEIESMTVTSGKTVYLAPGAMVYGKALGDGKGGPPVHGYGGPIFWLKGDNITLRGRGIIDGSRMLHRQGNILVAQGKNIRVEGVTLRDSSSWTFPVIASDHVKIQNIKIFGWRGNSDGIDICNSRNVDVSDCFMRTYDDLVVIKTNDPKAGPATDIKVTHCVLWNELAHALSIGAELRAPVENVLFSDCDIVHDKGREWDLRVYNCDSAEVKNIVFDKIRIQEAQKLFSLWIGKAVWSNQAERGHIDDITFRNIESVTPSKHTPFAELRGFDAQHAIHDVKFENVVVGGKAMRANDVKENKFVSGVSVKP